MFGEYPSGKAVVYYNAVRQTINLAEALDYYIFYYAATDKIIVLQQFRSEGRTIIATSIFRIGINITDIRLIVYISQPRILLDYAQESGRTGRDRLKSEAVIIIRESQFAEPEEVLVDRLVDSFVKGQRYKRKILDRYLDSKKNRVRYEEVEVPYKVYIKKLQIKGPIKGPRVEDSPIQ